MDKQELLRGLSKALEIAKKREDFTNREIMPKYRALMQKAEDAEEPNLLYRIKYSAIPLVINLFAIFVIDMVAPEVGTPFEEAGFLAQFFSILWIVSGALVLGVNVFARQIYPKTKVYTERRDKLFAEEQELIKKYSPTINKSKEESMKVLPQLGYDYHTVRGLSKMIGYLESGRADTIKELIEAYELDCHRERVEAKQDRIMYELEEQQGELNRLSSQVDYVKYYK